MNRTFTSQQSSFSSIVTNLLFTGLILLFFFTMAHKANGQCSSFACKSSINVSLGANGKADITPAMIMATTVGCPPLGTVTLMLNGVPLTTPDQVNCNQVGLTLTAKLVHQYGNSCWSNVKVEDKLGPTIACKDTVLNCIDAAASATANPPLATDNCTPVNNLSYTQTVNNFGCGTSTVIGFNGPYEMWKWTTCLPNGGNGTVNQSLMPNQITLVGASAQPVKTNPRYVTQYKAMATGYGYVKFDWMLIGSGNPNVDAVYFTVNDTCVQLSKTNVLMGTFVSWYIKPGDIIRFEQASDGDMAFNSTKINNFSFVGDVLQQITRTWTASDAYGNTSSCVQNINVKRLQGGLFIFPPNYNDIDKPVLACGANTDPAATGYPIWDQDGNPATTNDQTIIKQAVAGCIKMAYQDQVLTTCPGSKTVLREWTLLENCAAIAVKKTQIIKVYDKIPPVLTCPPNITVSANLPNCKGNVTLPLATATDACSGVATVVATWKFGTGQGPFVAMGTNIVTYTATDNCGNSSTCTMTVTVKDDVPPVAVGKNNLVVSLTVGGMAFVAANSFNDGSTDNCCLDKFEIKRMDDNDPFGPQVKFSCADAGKIVIVILKVWDCNGNFNTVMLNVSVQDKLAPTFTFCPANVTVDCGTDLTNLTKYGTPTAVDDCTFTMMYVETPAIQGMCGTGSITRTWTATDNGGKTAVCTQVITVKNTTAWNTSNTKIVWPLDYTVTSCTGTNPLDPNSLPFPYNKPSFKDLTPCTNPLANYTDNTFSLNSSTCFKILRKWTIIDWCSYNPSSPSGFGKWEYTQTINVMDNQVPDLFVPKDTVILAQDKDCKAVFVTLPKVTAKDCSPNVTITNNFSTNGADASGTFPYGLTTIKFTASDGCGNITVKEIKVLVKDGKKPTPICFHGFSTTITPTNGVGNGGEAWIFAKMLNAGSYDNCTEKKKLKFSFSANVSDTMRQYTCDSLGQRFIRLWVTDESGNQDYCDTYIDIQNNMGACKGGTGVQMYNVAGAIKTEELKEVEKVNMNITYAGSVGIVTDPNGKFLFKNIPGSAYKITPIKDINHINGVSTFDLYLMNRHILGLQIINSPYRLIAADVDNNNKITVSDVNELRKLILGIYTTLPNNKSWRFIPKSFTFPTPTNPWSAPFPELLDVTVNANLLNNDFVGLKVGDLNANAQPNASIIPSVIRTDINSEAVFENTLFDKNQTLRIPITISNLSETTAAQFTIGFDTKMADFVGVEKGTTPDFNTDAFNFSDLNEGLIRSAWFRTSTTLKNEDVLYYLTLKTKASGHLSDLLSLDSRLIAAETYNNNGEAIKMSLRFKGVENNKFELYQNQPNPFNGSTVIAYQSPEQGEATLKIYNTAGTIIKTLRQDAAIGYNQFNLSKDELGVHGVFMYRIEMGKYQAVRKMVILN